MPKKQKPARPGEPTQKTKTGYEIPVPKTEDFERLLKKAAERQAKPKRA